MPKRDFLWFDTTEMENSFRNIGKMIPKKVENLYEAVFYAVKTIRLNIKEDYFKITNLAAGKKLVENFKGQDNRLR
jgi:hypothetical protein